MRIGDNALQQLRFYRNDVSNGECYVRLFNLAARVALPLTTLLPYIDSAPNGQAAYQNVQHDYPTLVENYEWVFVMHSSYVDEFLTPVGILNAIWLPCLRPLRPEQVCLLL